MRVRDTIAAALAVLLLLQSVALAQAPLESVVQPVPREWAIRILLSSLSPGAEVRVQLASTEIADAGHHVCGAETAGLGVEGRSRLTGAGRHVDGGWPRDRLLDGDGVGGNGVAGGVVPL